MTSGPVRAILLDVQGTLFASGRALPGAAAAVASLRERGLGIRFLTNIDSKSPTVADALAGTGLEVPLGDDVLDYPVLDGAFRALRAGAELLALQRGRYFLRDDGDHLDTGGVVAALEYCAGVQARVLGKPSTDFFALAAGSLGVSIQECVVVGDDATTDIAGGREAGARTVQVRTGKYAVPAMQLVSVSGSAIVFHIGIGACDKDARGLVSESVELIVIGGVRDTTGCRSVLHPCSRSSPG